MSGTAAAALGLTQGLANLSSPGGQHTTTAQYMDSIVQAAQSEGVGFGSFQTTEQRTSQALAAWAQSIDGYGHQFLNVDLYHPAGRIKRSDDQSRRDVQPGGRERADAGGRLYKFRRRNRRLAGHYRPRGLQSGGRQRADTGQAGILRPDAGRELRDA